MQHMWQAQWQVTHKGGLLMPISTTSAQVFDIIWNGSKFVAVGSTAPSFSSLPQIAYSTDGITWSAATNTSSVFSTNSSVIGLASKPSPNLYPPR